MKKKNVFTLLIVLPVLLCSMPAQAQLTGTITAGGKPVAGAAILLLNATDSARVKATTSNHEGFFELNPATGSRYIISASSIGHKTYYSDSFGYNSKSKMMLPEIRLQADGGNTLSAVTVKSVKPLIERKADRTIVNVEALASNAGGNALEVLELSPGVQVDNNDVISLKGKAGVTIYIDDKPTYLSGADLASYLKSLPSSMLDKIEIMTTPPAKYDAAGNAGIINIKTKKSKTKGFNGSLNPSFRQGKYLDTRTTFNFNYRNNKINTFGNLVFWAGNMFSDLSIARNYTRPDGTPESGFNQNTYTKRKYTNFIAKAGLDYSPDKKNSLGFVFNHTGRPSKEQRNNNGYFFNPQNITDSTIMADNAEDEIFRNNSVNFYYRHQFDSTGREISADLDYINYSTGNEQLFKNASYNAGNNLKYRDELTGSLPSNLDIYSFKTDYTHPFKSGLKIEAGLKASYIKTDNIARYYTTVSNVTTPDYDKTNHFLYRESINAAYINFSKDIRRFSLQLGFRLENTVSKGHQLGNPVKPDSSFSRNYSNLFPTVFVSYKLDSAGNSQLNFSYSRRIDRPYYADLNPFVSPLDKFTYYAGNPFLNPQFTHHFELSHAYKNMLNTSVFYDRVTNEMNETIELSGTTFISRTGNIGKKDVAGFSVDATIKPRKWWTILPYLQYVYLHTTSKVYTEDVDTRGGFWNTSVTHQFSLPKGWSLELLGRYRSKIRDGQFDIGETGVVNLGIVKKFTGDHLSAKMVFQDIFRTRVNQGDINSLKNGSGYYRNLMDSRAVVLAFTYRFSKGAKSSLQNRKSGAESEQSRVKE